MSDEHEQPTKCFQPCGPNGDGCSHCGRDFTVRGARFYEPDLVFWAYESDYKPILDSNWPETDKRYCTKACALKARKASQ